MFLPRRKSFRASFMCMSWRHLAISKTSSRIGDDSALVLRPGTPRQIGEWMARAPSRLYFIPALLEANRLTECCRQFPEFAGERIEAALLFMIAAATASLAATSLRL